MARAEVELVGMKELRKSLRDMSDDTGWRNELRGLYGAVGSLVESESRSRAGAGATTVSGAHASMGGQAIGSIKGKGTTTGATLTGGSGIAWFRGWNFGTTGAMRQFPFAQEPDYAMYAAIKAKREQITDEFAEAVEAALESAFPG